MASNPDGRVCGEWDYDEGRDLWCEVRMDAGGVVVLRRSGSCTLADAQDLCRLVVSGDLAVVDAPQPH